MTIKEQIQDKVRNKEFAAFKIKFDSAEGLWLATKRGGTVVIKNAHFFNQCVAAISRSRKGMEKLFSGAVSESDIRKALSDLSTDSIYIGADDTELVFTKDTTKGGGGSNGK